MGAQSDADTSVPTADVVIPASFRDPAGRLFVRGGRIFRAVNETGVADLNAFLASQAGRGLLEAGSVAGTRALDDAERREMMADPAVAALCGSIGAAMILEHERIAFPSFPYEWPPEMLHAAASLTLDLAKRLLPENLGLKDGTPYNILFRGPVPVFIDVLSFERRVTGDAIWLPYAQFIRTFLLPLLANKYYGLPLDLTLSARRDGLEPEEVYRWATPFQRLAPLFLSLVTLPTWMSKRGDRDYAAIYRKTPFEDPERARFTFDALLNRLRRTLKKLKPSGGGSSTWSTYMASNNNYSAEHFAAKKGFVEGAMREFRPKRVLDVGCNTGFFSAIAARAGASVVAVDYDPVVVGETWRGARAEGLDILPLVVNLTRPTPGIGWRNRECASFLDRARVGFDAVLMLAVIHHMLVTERVPLGEIVDLAADLTTDLSIVEFVSPEDSMFRRLTRGREELHRGLNASVFESACLRRFDIVRSQVVDGATRSLYLLRRKAPARLAPIPPIGTRTALIAAQRVRTDNDSSADGHDI